MFDSKLYALVLLAVVALSACTTTTTTPVEPEALTVPETDAVVPSAPVAMPHHATSVRSVTTRQSQSVSALPKSRQNPAAEQVLTDQSLADEAVAAPAAAATDPLTEQYEIDAPEFDPVLGEESSESSASSEEAETSEMSESSEPETAKESSEHATASERSASRASNPSSDSAESAASSSESAQERAPEPESAEPQSASADKKETGSSGSKELSDEALSKEQISGGGSPSSELPTPAEATPAAQEKDVPMASVTGAEPQSEPPKQEASAGAEVEKSTGAAGGMNVPSEQPAVSDKTDHSKHDHRYIADQHVEGAEEEPTKKSKTLHWNMQRQVRKVVE